MTQQDYEQKKHECWIEFKTNTLFMIDEEAFGYAFDRAYALGKQEKDAEDTVISGWGARDKEGDIFLYSHEPKRIYDGEYSRWEEDVVCTQPLPHELFSDLSWNDDPIEVELIIKRKKKNELV